MPRRGRRASSRSKASSSSTPTSGEICSNPSWRASSAAGGRGPAGLGEGLLGGRPLVHPVVGSATPAGRGQAFPASPPPASSGGPSSGPGAVAAHSSRTTSSGGAAAALPHPDAPGEGGQRGVEADLLVVGVDPAQRRRGARRAATRSMAPRTDEPTRTSGWSRLARAASTARRARAVPGGAGARRATTSPLGRRVLVAHRDPAHPVVDGGGDAGGADGVEGVHGRHDAEARARPPTRPSRGTCSSRSLMAVMTTLSVSSGTRLISSR